MGSRVVPAAVRPRRRILRSPARRDRPPARRGAAPRRGGDARKRRGAIHPTPERLHRGRRARAEAASASTGAVTLRAARFETPQAGRAFRTLSCGAFGVPMPMTGPRRHARARAHLPRPSPTPRSGVRGSSASRRGRARGCRHRACCVPCRMSARGRRELRGRKGSRAPRTHPRMAMAHGHGHGHGHQHGPTRTHCASNLLKPGAPTKRNPP